MIGFSIRHSTKNEILIQSVTTTSIMNTSKSTIVLETNSNKILYEINPHQQMLPASLTKVLTAYVCLKYYDLNDYLIVNEKMINVEGSKIYLKLNQIISIKDLLYGLMLCSGNDAAMALALHYSGDLNDFIDLMNLECKKLNMINSHFENPHGLDSENSNLTTAYDLAILFAECLKMNEFREITKTTYYKTTIYSGENFIFRNKHRLIHSCDNATGGKTGYTKKAGRTLITSFKDSMNEIVIVTLDAYDDWNLHKSLSSQFLNNTKVVFKKLNGELSTFFYFKRFKKGYFIDE